MSRRSSITRIQAQQRAASRMTVGTSMWTEQPLAERRDRWRATEPVPDSSEEPLVPPAMLQYIKYRGGAPQSYSINMNAGQQAVFVCTASAGRFNAAGGAPQPMDIGPGWTILKDESQGGQRRIIVTRRATNTGVTLVVSTPPKTFTWNELGMAGFLITPNATTPQRYKISVPNTWWTITNGTNLHAWQGPASLYRLRALTARGLYANWTSGTVGDGCGHYRSQMGYYSPQTDWYVPGRGGDPLTYLKGAWYEGWISHRSIGAAGPVHWTEDHIQLEPA